MSLLNVNPPLHFTLANTDWTDKADEPIDSRIKPTYRRLALLQPGSIDQGDHTGEYRSGGRGAIQQVIFIGDDNSYKVQTGKTAAVVHSNENHKP